MDAEKKKRPDMVDNYEAMRWYYTRYAEEKAILPRQLEGWPVTHNGYGVPPFSCLGLQEAWHLEDLRLLRLCPLRGGLVHRAAQLGEHPDPGQGVA